ncbi:hypothetical protein [Haladaptatus sp. NG-SE-30]
MEETNNRSSKLKRRGYLKGVAAAGMGAGVLTNFAGRASAQSNDVMDVDGDSVYLLFGLDTSSTDLESWVEDNKGNLNAKSQQASSEVIQYQNVSQLNVNQQSNAVSISINGGQAEAIQRTYQNNENTQAGSAQSINAGTETEKQKFEGVKNVYIVFAEETECREFAGWVVSDDTYESEQSAEATIEQDQEVEQFNYNSQSTAVAIAEDSSYSRAYQRSYQENNNYQSAEALAANSGDGDSQTASSSVIQSQDVTQVNVNEQGVAVAIAVGSGSVAKAWQISCQYNVNQQIADATAINVDPKSIEEVTASAKIEADVSDVEITHSKDGDGQSNQVASADITQVQRVGQENINMQNAAVAVALQDSEATATQASYQANFNAQVAEATAVNVDNSHHEACKVMSGTDAKGDGSWAVAYDEGTQQTASVDITQTQVIQQLNVNEQFSAVAFAVNHGNATAEQLNYQVNENIQAAEVTAVNESGSENGEKDHEGKKGHHHGKKKKKGHHHGKKKKKGHHHGKKKKKGHHHGKKKKKGHHHGKKGKKCKKKKKKCGKSGTKHSDLSLSTFLDFLWVA